VEDSAHWVQGVTDVQLRGQGRGFGMYVEVIV
jgi:hypothetical protein